MVWHTQKQRFKRRVLSNNFLKILQKLQLNYFSKTYLVGYFKLTSDISIKSVGRKGLKWARLKNQEGETMGQNTRKYNFLYDLDNFNKKLGVEGGLLYFIVELYE